MVIPEHLKQAARNYCEANGGDEATFKAFVEGYMLTQNRMRTNKIDFKKIESYLDSAFVERKCDLMDIDPTMNGLELSLALLFVDALCSITFFVEGDFDVDPKGYKKYISRICEKISPDKDWTESELYHHLLDKFIGTHFDFYLRIIKQHFVGNFSDKDNIWYREDMKDVKEIEKVLDGMEQPTVIKGE